MDSGVKRRLTHGVVANLYGQLVTVVVQLAGVPVLLHAWGAQKYGEWLLIFAVPAVLSASDLGLCQSASNDMTARVARGDRAGALSVFQSLLVFVLVICTAVLLLASVVLPALDVRALLNLQTISAQDAQLMLWLLAASILIRLPNAITHAGYRCNGENAVHVGIDATTRLVQQLSIWAIAFFGGGPVDAALAQLVVAAIATPVAAALMLARHRWLRFGARHFDLSQLTALARPAFANAAIPIGQAISLQGVSVLVGVVAGSVALVAFTTTRTLARLVTQLVLAIGDAAEPELATAHGANNLDLVRQLFAKVSASTFWLAVVGSMGLMICGGWLIKFWTGGAVAVDSSLIAVLVLSAFFTVATYGSLVLLKAANEHGRGAALMFGSAIVCVGSSWLFLQVAPTPTSAAAAVLMCDVLTAVFIVRLGCAHVGVRPIALLSSNLRAPLAVLSRGSP